MELELMTRWPEAQAVTPASSLHQGLWTQKGWTKSTLSTNKNGPMGQQKETQLGYMDSQSSLFFFNMEICLAVHTTVELC